MIPEPSEVAKVYRQGDLTGAHYICSGCGQHGLRLWRQTHTMLNNIDLLCATCAEIKQREAIEEYKSFHQPTDPAIGNLVPARPTPEGDTFWGHSSGDVEWWYRLPQYPDAREHAQIVLERNHFLSQKIWSESDWLKTYRRAQELESALVAERASREAAERELERWRHDETVEGDFVCPNELAATSLQAKLAQVEAESAALRETLEAVADWCEECTCVESSGLCVFCQCTKALATDAGCDLLKRLESAECVCECVATAALDEVGRVRLAELIGEWRATKGT